MINEAIENAIDFLNQCAATDESPTPFELRKDENGHYVSFFSSQYGRDLALCNDPNESLARIYLFTWGFNAGVIRNQFRANKDEE
jgi:hypothetical protein